MKKLLAGIFVLSAMVLLVTALILLGVGDKFATQGKFATRFTESVQGLNVGSPVKYRGVLIGSVSDIVILTEGGNENSILVRMNVNFKSFPQFSRGKKSSLNMLYDFFAFEVRRGLRCRMEFTSMATGLKYIELDFHANPGDYDGMRHHKDAPDAFFIPSSPSSLKNLLSTVSNSLEKISKIRFEEISNGITTNLSRLNEMINDPQIKKTISNMEKITEKLNGVIDNVSGTFTGEKMKTIAAQLDRNLSSIEKLTDQLEGQIQKSKLPDTAKSIKQAAESASELKSELSDSISKLNRALDNLNEFVEMLREDPSSLVSGKQAPR